MLPWLLSSKLSKIAILSMADYYYWCNTFYYNQMQFQLACSVRRMQMHIYPLLYCYRYLPIFIDSFFTFLPSIYQFMFYISEMAGDGDTHYLHTYCTTVLINQYLLETRMRYFKIVLSRQEIVVPCVHFSLHSMLKYFLTQHFPRTLCPLP